MVCIFCTCIVCHFFYAKQLLCNLHRSDALMFYGI